MASKEDQLRAQLQELGIYDPAFDGEIHALCIMERELSRTMKAWKATAPDKKTPPDVTDPHYDVICRLRRDILQHRDALGLTPKALQRLRKAQAGGSGSDAAPIAGTANPGFASVLDAIKEAAYGRK